MADDINNYNESRKSRDKILNDLYLLFKKYIAMEKAKKRSNLRKTITGIAVGLGIAGSVMASNTKKIAKNLDNPDPNDLKKTEQVANKTATTTDKLVRDMTQEEKLNEAIRRSLPDNKEYLGDGNPPRFNIDGDKLVVEGANDTLQSLVSRFNQLQNQDVKSYALDFISEVMQNSDWDQTAKAITIVGILRIANQESFDFRINKTNNPYRKKFKELADKAGVSYEEKGTLLAFHSEDDLGLDMDNLNQIDEQDAKRNQQVDAEYQQAQRDSAAISRVSQDLNGGGDN
jgi:hypothetical protein